MDSHRRRVRDEQEETEEKEEWKGKWVFKPVSLIAHLHFTAMSHDDKPAALFVGRKFSFTPDGPTNCMHCLWTYV